MLSQETLIQEAAEYKKDSKGHFDEALVALLALFWPYRTEKFALEDFPAIYADAMDICITLSDKCAESAKKRLLAAIDGQLESVSDEDVWESAFGDEQMQSFDMAGVHLIDLLSVWIGVAVVNGWTQGYTRVMISRYLANPFACPEWKLVPRNAVSWGRGYDRNISEQLWVIGLDIIIYGARHAEQIDETAKGATFYIRRRGSGYNCKVCDEMANIPFPIDVPFEIPHARCCCWPEYHYEPME